MLKRRTFLRVAGATVLAQLAGARLVLAAPETDRRLVVVVLRGGLDGLHALAPYADPDYRRARPRIAVPAPGATDGALDLDGYFGLHPALATLHGYHRRGQLLALPGTGSGYRARSHFDGQNLLENGTTRPHGATDGWLNRAISAMRPGSGQRLGLALGPAVPLMMRGTTAVQTWSPTALPALDEDLLERLAGLYAEDPLLGGALAQATASDAPSMSGRGRVKARDAFKTLAKAAGELLGRTDGPRIAVLDTGGFDTHFGQQGRLAGALRMLDEGLAALEQELGATWSQTAVLVVSEFGRTVAENGSSGTDHGVGGLALVLGGAVHGGAFGASGIAPGWRGLGRSTLYEGRDVEPIHDYRSIAKCLLREHLHIDDAHIERHVFPGSTALRPLEGLIRNS